MMERTHESEKSLRRCDVCPSRGEKTGKAGRTGRILVNRHSMKHAERRSNPLEEVPLTNHGFGWL